MYELALLARDKYGAHEWFLAEGVDVPKHLRVAESDLRIRPLKLYAGTDPTRPNNVLAWRHDPSGVNQCIIQAVRQSLEGPLFRLPNGEPWPALCAWALYQPLPVP